MTILDQPDRWKAVDPRSMYSLVESFPDQITAAAGRALEAKLPDAKNVRAVVVTGLGGSAIAGDLVQSIVGPQLRVPLIVNRDYDLPGFVDSTSMVIACSYSGNTEETNSAYMQAHRAKASILCITSGGDLESAAKSNGHPVLSLPGGLPPRAALGYSLPTLLVALQRMGLVTDIGGSIEETVGLLRSLNKRYGVSVPESDNPAKKLAGSLFGKTVAIYGSSAIMGAVAFRWRTQIEENSKNLAFHHVLPEMNHNEIVGWRYPEDVLRGTGVALLRDRQDHPQVQRRFELTREILAGKAGVLHEIWSEGKSPLDRVLSMIFLGDYVSLYMAYLNGADPTPVETIDYLKKNLAHK